MVWAVIPRFLIECICLREQRSRPAPPPQGLRLRLRQGPPFPGAGGPRWLADAALSSALEWSGRVIVITYSLCAYVIPQPPWEAGSLRENQGVGQMLAQVKGVALE